MHRVTTTHLYCTRTSRTRLSKSKTLSRDLSTSIYCWDICHISFETCLSSVWKYSILLFDIKAEVTFSFFWKPMVVHQTHKESDSCTRAEERETMNKLRSFRGNPIDPNIPGMSPWGEGEGSTTYNISSTNCQFPGKTWNYSDIFWRDIMFKCSQKQQNCVEKQIIWQKARRVSSARVTLVSSV